MQRRLHGGSSLDTSITGSRSPGQTWPISRTLPLTPSFIKGPGSGYGEREGSRGLAGKEGHWPGLRRHTHTCICTNTHARGEAQGCRYTKSTVTSPCTTHAQTRQIKLAHPCGLTPTAKVAVVRGLESVEARGQSSPPLSHTTALTATGVVATRHAITRLKICSL